MDPWGRDPGADPWGRPPGPPIPEEPASPVRPFTVTGGRTTPRMQLALEALVSSATTAHYDLSGRPPEHRAIVSLCRQVRTVAESVPEVKAVETLWVRKSGLEYFADIHIEVDQHLTVAEGLRIGHQVKDHLLNEFPVLRDVLVHLEPFPHCHEPADKQSGPPSSTTTSG